MCGIAGLALHTSTPDPRVLDAMATSLAHRGPDGQGTWTGDGAARGIGLAHTRLAVIDPCGSPQPMSSADGRYTVVFNGEILNYRELRQGLDHPWRTQGDTEVLLAAFIRHGPAAFTMLAGQFACAIVDSQTGDLWLARDRMGILPLYWAVTEQGVVFASEPKGLAAAGWKLDVDRDAIDDYLTHRAVQAPRTLYREVTKLPAAHWMLVRGGHPSAPQRYWSARDVASSPLVPANRAAPLLEAALHEAVRRSLVADVPVGTYLSGGLDSSLVTALVAKARGGGSTTNTFAAGFGDPRTDELPFARLVADRLKTDHHEVHVREDDFVSLWPHLTWHRDAPVSEPADIAVFRLAEAARQHVTVVLSGDGGDELFGGYPKHVYARATAAAAHVPAALRAPLLKALERRVPPSRQRLRIALRALTGTGERDLLAGWFSPFTAYERNRLLGLARPGRHPSVDRAGRDALTRMLLLDVEGWLADNMLERGDRMSMAAGIELRPPYLDRDVVDLALRLPSSVKVRGTHGKRVLKDVARGYLPDAIVDRPKAGFKVPLDAWFRTGLREMTWDLLRDPRGLVGSRLDRTAVARLLQDHDTERHNEGIRLWTLLSLEVWHRTCVVERQGPTCPSTGGRAATPD